MPFEHFRDVIMPALIAARARVAPHPHLVRGRLDRPGALFARHVPQGDGSASSPAGASRSSAPTSPPRCWRRREPGIYSQFEVQRGLPIQLLIKYFTQVGEMWQIAPELRAMVKFRQLNLLADFAQLGRFDVVFCRNVLIYFDQQTKIDVLDRMAARHARATAISCSARRRRWSA